MKPIKNDELVTVMGGALGAATNPSWIRPLPSLFGSTAPKWTTPKTPTPGSTSWL